MTVSLPKRSLKKLPSSALNFIEMLVSFQVPVGISGEVDRSFGVLSKTESRRTQALVLEVMLQRHVVPVHDSVDTV